MYFVCFPDVVRCDKVVVKLWQGRGTVLADIFKAKSIKKVSNTTRCN